MRELCLCCGYKTLVYPPDNSKCSGCCNNYGTTKEQGINNFETKWKSYKKGVSQ